MQYIHPSDIAMVVISLMMAARAGYQVSAWLWKVGAHNEKADPGFIYGTYDPVVIPRPALTSPLGQASHSTASIVSSISNTG